MQDRTLVDPVVTAPGSDTSYDFVDRSLNSH